jgi:hypothetical protein
MMRVIRHLALATVLLIGVVACDDDSVTEPDPQADAILLISGGDQVLGTEEVSNPLVVRVNDQNGDPFQGAMVTFSGSGVDHSLSSTSGTTGTNGEASVTVTAGDEAGTVTVNATVAGAGTVSFTLTIEADEPDPEASTLEAVEGDGQTIEVNAASNPLVVRVDDQFGNAFQGAEVTFTGDGVAHSLSTTTADTDANGEASVVVTAGGDAGTITVAASVAGLDPVTFTITVEAPTVDPEAATLELVSGDGQTLGLNAESGALLVRVEDQFGAPFPGATVSFSGDGVAHTLADDAVTTDAAGEASITATAGVEEGTFTVTAAVAGLDPVTFTLTVEDDSNGDPGDPDDPEASALILVSGDGQTLDLNETSAALVVQVNDQFGNALPGVQVDFAGSGVAHDLSDTSVLTGANGRAFATVTAGAVEGAITVEAAVAGVGTVNFSLMVEEDVPDPEATALVIVSGDGQTLEPSELSAALVVRVDDQDTNPFEGAEVTFAIASGDGTLTSTTETTAANGQASTTVTAGTTEGALTISATVAGLTPVTFNLTIETTPTSFSTDFEEYATGAFPNDWTDRGLLAAATSITVEDTGGSNVLLIDLPNQDPSIHRGISWDEPGAQGDVRVEATLVPGAGAVPAYITARGTADDTYYRLQLRNGDLLELVKVVNNVPEVPITGAGSATAFIYQSTDVVHLEFEVEGSQLRGRAWIDGSAVPTDWDVEIADSDITADGWTGVGRLHEGVTEVRQFTVTPLN